MAKTPWWVNYAIVGAGAFIAYENWPTISTWFSSLTTSLSNLIPAAPAAAASGYYPNSPVPLSYPTNETFVDTAGNQWQFSTQTNTWVIATPAPAAAASSGTVVATAPVAAPPTTSPGTVVATAPVAAPPPTSPPAPPAIQPTQPPMVLMPQPGPIAWGGPPIVGPFKVAPSPAQPAPATPAPATNPPRVLLPRYRSY